MHQNPDGSWVADSSDEMDQVNNMNANMRGALGAAPAAPTAPPPTPQQMADATRDGMQFVKQRDGSYSSVPIAGAPQSNPVTGQTTVGVSDLQNDIANRQQMSSSTRPAAPTGQFTPISTNNVAQNLQGLGAAPGQATPAAGAPIRPAGAPLMAPGTGQAAAAGAGSFGSGVSSESKVQAGATQAKEALGPAPTIDMGLADRGQGAFQESLDMSREVLDRLLNAPSVTAAIGDQALSSQLAIARSARGGPGAVAAAVDSAENAAPAVTQQAAIQASAEQNQRLSTAGTVAGNFAQAALGGKQQDIQVATANQNAATTVLGQVAQLTGTQLTLDQQNQELIGQMARDFAAQDYNWAALSATQQNNEFDRWVQVYGIDKNFAAQIKAIAKSKSIGPLDVFNGIVGVIGGAATIGAAAVGGKK